MNYQEFHDKWKNLIFTPMDIPIPPCDTKKLQEFIDLYPGQSHDEKMQLKRHGKVLYKRNHDDLEMYNFFRSFHVIDTMPATPIICEVFAEMFPDVPEWLESLPLAPGKRFLFGWVSQLPPSLDSDSKVTSTIHVDEAGSFGLRWFINNFDNNLYFYGTKPDITIPDIIASDPNEKTSYGAYHDTLNTQYNNHDIPRANKYFYSEPIKISTQPHTGFMLGQHKAAHVIKPESHPHKCTFIVQPVGKLEDRWLWSDLNQIVEQSVKNHSTETIWHEDFCN